MRTTSVLCLLMVTGTAIAQVGDFDSSYATNGIFTWSYYPNNRYVGTSLALRSDGSAIVGASSDGFGIALHLSVDGVLDTLFGFLNYGYAPTNLAESYHITAKVFTVPIALQTDDKLLIAGRGLGAIDDFAMERHLTDGDLDDSFDGDGRVSVPLGPYELDAPFAVAQQPDGRIVLAGVASMSTSECHFGLTRFLDDGTLDTSFGSGGNVIVDTVSLATALAMHLQPDGRILLGGISTFSSYEALVMRLTPTGELDATLDGDGFMEVSFAPNATSNIITSLEMMPDGRFIVAGHTRPMGGFHRFGIARLHPDGTFDTSFGTNGRVDVPFDVYSFAFGTSLQADGKLIVVGTTSTDDDSPERMALCRLMPDGTLDPTFGTGGKLEFDMDPSKPEALYDVILQPDGRILVTGFVNDDGTHSDLFVARLLNGPILIGLDELQEDRIALLYPNPLSGIANLRYVLPSAARVSLRLEDHNGRQVRSFLNNVPRSGGDQNERLDVTGVPAGTYTVVITCNDIPTAVRVVVLP